MKTRSFKLFFLIFFFFYFQIAPTNSYLVDAETSTGNTLTAGCWSAPYTPQLISPSDNLVTNIIPGFDWNDSWVCPDKIVSYEFEAYSDAELTNKILHYDSLANSNITISPLSDGLYYWRVRAYDGENWSNWSSARKLTVDQTAPGSTTMTVTGSFSKTVDEKITNNWTTAGDVTMGNPILIGKTSGDTGKQVWENRLMQSFNSGAKTLSVNYDFHSLDNHDDPGFMIRLNGQQIFSLDSLNTGAGIFNYDLSNYPDGQKLNLAIYAGNTGDSENQSWVYIDKVTTTMVSAPGHATYHLSNSDSDINHFEYKIDGSDWMTGNSFTDLSDGSHVLSYRAVDNAGNIGPTSVTNVITDSVAPAAIDDLDAVTSGPNSVQLFWTAPGNDANLGRASKYDVRYQQTNFSNHKCLDFNYDLATKIDNVSAPYNVGTPETLEILGLNPDTTYCFAVKTIDEAPNWSGLSNLVDAKTDKLKKGATVSNGDVIINELMWMGTGAGTHDEYLELRNMTSRSLDLSNFKLLNNGTDMGINFSGKSIAPNGYFLITNYNPGSTDSDLKSSVTADIVDSSLVLDNDNLDIELVDAFGNIIDRAGDGNKPFAGENTSLEKYSMERTDVPGDGTDPLNWYTCIDSASTTDFFNGVHDDRGTPGAKNRSVNEPVAPKIASPSAAITNDGKKVSFKVINLNNFLKLSYTLTYDSDQAPQGATGSVDLSGVTEYTKDNILLGTCSTGGTCTYNTGVKNIRLDIQLEDKNGKTTSLTASL